MNGRSNGGAYGPLRDNPEGSGGGDGGSGGRGMEARVAVLEDRIQSLATKADIAEINGRLQSLATRLESFATKEDIQKVKVWVLSGVLGGMVLAATLAIGIAKIFF